MQTTFQLSGIFSSRQLYTKVVAELGALLQRERLAPASPVAA